MIPIKPTQNGFYLFDSLAQPIASETNEHKSSNVTFSENMYSQQNIQKYNSLRKSQKSKSMKNILDIWKNS